MNYNSYQYFFPMTSQYKYQIGKRRETKFTDDLKCGDCLRGAHSFC